KTRARNTNAPAHRIKRAIISKEKKEWPTNPITDPKQFIIIPNRSNLLMPNCSDSFPYTDVPMENVNIKDVFTKIVLAGGLLKSFAISGNETFKTISLNTLKTDKMQSQIKIWLWRKFDYE